MTGASTASRTFRTRAAAQRGRVLSRTLCASFALLAFALAMDAGIDAARGALAASFEPTFSAAAGQLPALSTASYRSSGGALLSILGPLLAAIAGGALAAGALQLGMNRVPRPRAAERTAPFDPSARARQLLDPDRALDAVVTAVIVAVLATVAWLTVGPNVRGVLALPGADVALAGPLLIELLSTLALRLALAGLALGALDHLQRRVRVALRSRPTARELLDEQREQYGDPQLRAERTRRMREGAARRSSS